MSNRHISFFLLACCGLILLLTSSPVLAQRPTLVSTRHGDISSGSGSSYDPVVSANGRFVAFESVAFNLAANDSNGRADVFWRDLQTGTTTLVSVNLSGVGTGNGDSKRPTMSADGRYVTFESDASNLVANDNNSRADVFVRDMQTGITTLVSLSSAGGIGNQESLAPVINSGGQVVVFKSFASNLVPNDNNNTIDIFAHDLQTGITSLVSCNVACTGTGNGPSFTASVPKNKSPRNLVSNDGRFVVFESYATDLVTTNDANGVKPDVFVRDRQAGTTALVSINRFGTGSANAESNSPVISGNGRFVFFQSGATDLTVNDTGFGLDLFVRDLQTGITSLVSVTATGIGSDGSGNGSYLPVVSEDGRYVAFQSNAKHLVANDSNSDTDIFRRDLQANTTTLVSVNRAGGTSAGSVAIAPVMSADGRFVAFIGFNADLVATSDANRVSDVFLRDLTLGTTTLLSLNSAGNGTAERGGSYPVISADGRFVFFESSSTDMVPNPVFSDNIFAVAVNGQVRFDASALDVNETDKEITVSVTRTGNTGGALTVYYAASNGTATASTDYAATSGSLTFVDGETGKTITIPIIDDNVDEPNEKFIFTLSDFAAVGDAPGSLSMNVLTIADNDAPPSLSIEDVVITEGNNGEANAAITLGLSAPSSKMISVDVLSADGTATLGVDYQHNFTKVFITPGSTSQKFNVQIAGDIIFEDDETFFLNLSNPTDATVADGQGVVTIRNDDPTPSVTINDVKLAEGNAGILLFNFSIRLSNPSSRQVSVQLDTANGTAEAGSDYLVATSTLIFNPGTTFTTKSIVVNGDTFIEPDETFFVNLSNPAGASLTDAQGVGTIVNDDTSSLQFGNATFTTAEGGGRATVTVTRTGDTSGVATLDYRTTDTDTFTVGCFDAAGSAGSAYARCDFATVVGTLSFASGETSKTITVPLIDDGHAEGAETFQVLLGNVAGATLGTPDAATVTITDNDSAGAQNPVAASFPFFVRQQYLDFLSREPDQGGFDAWLGVLNGCPNAFTGPGVPSQCDRIYVSGEGFFRSLEFQLKGFYVFRFYRVAFDRLPEYTEIVADMSFVAGQTAEEVYARRAQLATAFTQKQEFQTLYGEMTNAQYVSALLGRYDLSEVTAPDPQQPDTGAKVRLTSTQLTDRLMAGTLTRAQVLRAVADSDAVGTAEFNNAFVGMQYYGYLRRKPDQAGFDAWLRVLQSGDVRTMVDGFLNSTEYKLRFGQL
ncbi:MAG TPA: Calx-beta domain-containing protein [Pyrinomonadaceae bacterium]